MTSRRSIYGILEIAEHTESRRESVIFSSARDDNKKENDPEILARGSRERGGRETKGKEEEGKSFQFVGNAISNGRREWSRECSQPRRVEPAKYI